MALCLLVSTEGWAELKASTWHYETPVLECSCYWERQARTKTSRMECSSYAVAPPLTCTRTSCYMCYFMNAFDRFEQAATLSFELDGCGHLCEILWNKMQWHSKQDCLLAIQDVARAWDQTRDEILEIVQIQSPDRIDPHQLAISSDILSDIYSDSLFEFAFSCMFWHSRCPFVWHSIWHIIWHSLWQSLT